MPFPVEAERDRAMTKKDIVRTIAEEIGLPQQKAREFVQTTFDTLVETLVREGRIELRNFGIFQIKQREARIGRNPRTGEEVPVAARRVVVFKPGKKMEEKVQKAGGFPNHPPRGGDGEPDQNGSP
jgi:integration host factor alpha subunit